MPKFAQPIEMQECRQCCTFCDRVVHPSACVAAGCRFLYFYDDEKTGSRFMGCLNKVFDVEIDVQVLAEAERTRHGFGGVKLTGQPLSICRTTVERAYDGHGDAFECINQGFWTDPALDDDDTAAFDLRDSL